ncbi:transposase IS116/IS110/IS902 family protein [Orientia tsutsugamushi str. UT76]|uniref:IS110 family transposase n=1 Tax=Orientia tsutsugamushi TaxID=784 RepID=A0A2U3REC7_ORITS|nr:transposase IS116/IS110/IS902 family protein [Orientia tsutsugamushi str. UT76]SPR11565.1 IS110 family transposase [Orientia tsutsugamushi]
MRCASRISRTGNSDLRKAFYMLAMSALRHNFEVIMKFDQIKELEDEKFHRLTRSKEGNILKDSGYFEAS